MRRIAILFLFVFAGSKIMAAPTIQMRMEVSPHEVYLGDVIEGRIVVSCAKDVTPVPPEPQKTLGEFEVRSWNPKPIKEENDRRVSEIEFQVVTFSTGSQTLPSISLNFKAKDGSLSEAKTDAIPITVKSLLQEKGDEGRLRPLKGTIDFRSWRWLVIVLAMLMAAGVVYWLWSLKTRKLRGSIPQGPVKKPEEIAWDAIHELEDSDWIAQGKVKEYYSRLSDIARAYIEARFHLQALEKTTSELVIDLRTLPLSGEVSSSLRVFLDTADLVKFAKFSPTEAEISTDLLRVKEFVSKTTPEEIKPAATGAKRKEEIPL